MPIKNTNRRKFLKHTAIGSVALAGLSGWAQVMQAATRNSKNNLLPETDTEIIPSVVFADWLIAFDEKTAILTLKNNSLALSGKLTFVSGDETWTISHSRDGVPNRYALVNPQGDVQGYFVFLPNGSCLQLLFYHRTAQAYPGTLSYTGTIAFFADAFPCRTQAAVDERVLALSAGKTNSSLNDSLFSPEKDCLLQLQAANLQIYADGNETYAFSLSGRIEETAEAIFTINPETNYFRRRYVPYYHALDRKRTTKAPTGWMSWNTYFDKAGAVDNLNEAKIGAKYLLPFGCEFWSIESWQGHSDHLPVCDFYNMDLEVNEKQFPKGMKKLADDIRALGFRPGLWMAPFGTGNKDFYNAHKNWFLHDKKGTPIGSWNGIYTLDPTVKEAREHLKNIFRKASREWGYEFFKIDGMSGRNRSYCAHLYERPEIRAQFHNPNCPNPFELCVQAFREGIGDDRVFLACQGHSSGPEPKYADASRLGADIVHPDEPVRWSNILNQGKCFTNQAFTHNIVMVADPDTLLVHGLPIEEARVTATIVALPGQLTFFGDKLAGLSDGQMKILQQTLPVADVRPVSLYPYFSMLPVWNLHINNELLGNYNVIALFNWDDTPKTITTTAKELGVADTMDYTAYEFWTEKALPLAGKSLNLSVEVPAHGVRLVALHPLKAIPQWVGSDRHIAQNAVELIDYKWNTSIRGIEGNIRLAGTFPVTMRIHVPENYSFGKVICEQAKYSVRREEGNLLAITFRSEKSANAPFRIIF
jgi:hypothetical protein